MNNIIIKTALGLFILATLLLMADVLIMKTPKADASAPSGLPATEAVATTTVLGPQSTTTILAASACSARVVGTTNQGIMLLFADPSEGDLSSTTIASQKGFWQAASTTVAYDSGVYGCGRFIGRADASTTVTVMETR